LRSPSSRRPAGLLARALLATVLLAAALLARPALAGPPAAPPPLARVDVLAEAEQAHQALFERVAPAVVLVVRGGSLGTGFFVRPDGLVLTSAHVVGEEKSVSVVLHDGRRVTGQVVERAAGNVDLALVQAPVEGVAALELDALADVRVGSFAAAVGHGEGDKGALWTFGVGLVSNIHPVGSERPVLQTQIPLNPGSSGAPVVNRSGRVIGVVTAGIKEANAINFAIRADVAVRSLARLSSVAGYLVVTAPVGANVFVDGAHAGVGPRVALPAKPGRREILVVVGGRLERRVIEFPQESSVEVR
jgi:S1-C subfamily serine protease